MTSNFLSQGNKLRNVQLHLENSLKSCRDVFDDPAVVTSLEKRASERFKECQDSRVSVLNILEQLNALKLELFNGNSFDLEQLKNQLIAIQECSRNIRADTQAKLTSLIEQEVILTEEVLGLGQELNEYDKVNPIRNHLKREKSKVLQKPLIAKEVETFGKFVHKTGGHQNGWRPKDHTIFLKIRRKYNNDKQKMIEVLLSIFPEMSADDIEAHEKWYLEYAKLQGEQKEAIKRWRGQQVQIGNDEPDDAEDNVIRKPIWSCHEQRNIKERLALWKKDKDEQLLEHQRLMSVLNGKVLEVQKRKKAKHEETKLEVLKWKREKELKNKCLEEQRSLDQQFKQELRLMDEKRLIKQFQSQDEIFVKRRLEMRHSKDDRGTEIARKPSVSVNRNPERLLQPTRQWLSRLTDDHEVKDRFWTVGNKPKLRIPQWRKEIS